VVRHVQFLSATMTSSPSNHDAEKKIWPLSVDFEWGMHQTMASKQKGVCESMLVKKAAKQTLR